MLGFQKEGLLLEEAVKSYFKVRYAETDQMKFMYYGRYFEWFEVGRVDWIKSRGISYKLLEENNCFLPVVEVKARYLAPNQYDDEICVFTWLKSLNKRSVEYFHIVNNLSKGQYTTEAEVKLMVVNGEGRPSRIPEKYYNYFCIKKGLDE